MKYLIIPVILGVVILLSVTEEIAFSVYGGFIEEAQLDAYFAKHLNQYSAANYYYDNDLLLTEDPFLLPYVAKQDGILGNWVIEDYGRIPRWSKWHGKLNDWSKPVEPVKPELSDL